MLSCAQPPAGPKGIAAILGRCPELMLCKPTTNDRWDRRAVELGAYLLRHGHCNVPEVRCAAPCGVGPCRAACCVELVASNNKLCHAVPCRAVLRCAALHAVPLLDLLLAVLHLFLIFPSSMQDWPENPELGLWVKRQRIARAAGQLRCEQAQRSTAQEALHSAGYSAGRRLAGCHHCRAVVLHILDVLIPGRAHAAAAACG